MKYLLIGFVKLWRMLISPLYGDVCKYYPSCSEYGLEALQFHGAVKGSWLTIRRIARCHPWAHEAVDFVPGTPRARSFEADEALTAARATDLTHAGVARTTDDVASSSITRGDA